MKTHQRDAGGKNSQSQVVREGGNTQILLNNLLNIKSKLLFTTILIVSSIKAQIFTYEDSLETNSIFYKIDVQNILSSN
jgi:hypothetical protein